MFEDEKVNFIESLPEADTILVIWIKLLTLAGKCNANGFIFLTEKIPFTDEMLSHRFSKQLSTVKLALQTLIKLEMIEIDDQGFLKIINWEKHQNIEGLDRVRELTKHRVARHRENQKLLNDSNVTSNVTVTHGNATELELELDKELDKDIYILSSTEKEFFDILSKIKNYPIDKTKDLDMFQRLEERYKKLDLVEAIKDWSAYKLDKPLNKKDNARSQINTSFKKYLEWGKCLKADQIPIKNKTQLDTDHNYDMDDLEKRLLKKSKGG